MKKETYYRSFIAILRILLAVFLILTFLSFWYVNQQSGYDKQWLTYSAELRVLFERLARHAGESVVQGKEDAFTYLKYRRNEITAIIEILKRGKQDETGKLLLPPSPSDIQNKELADLSRLWTIERTNTDIILNNQGLILGLHKTANSMIDILKKIEQSYLDILDVFAAQKNVNGQVFAGLASQIASTHALADDIRQILNVSNENPEVDQLFSQKIQAFEANIQAEKAKFTTDVIYSKLLDIDKSFSVIKDRANDLVQTYLTETKINAAYNTIYAMIPKMLEYTTNLEKAYDSMPQNRAINIRTAYALSVITFLILLALIYFMYKENQYSLKRSEKETRELEAEIQKLVNELKDLANGDLTVQATKGKGVTVAIADAVNYALNALRKLVVDINQTSQKVSSSAKEVKKVTQDLVKAIHNQTEEITNTGTSVSTMTSFIDQVSQNAKQSASVAENSVEIAHEGATIVNDTISGMERIREQIRETEKRIQRLSESSTEIGEIVSVIDGISEQTNILSLNAAIQAAMAGDVGMGFAVVADEVQQLAVKSSQAAKDVETIVKAIRTDTSRAAESMGKAISEVSMGTDLAHNAGRALEKIETVSKSLSDLIQGISKASEEQSQMSGKISKMMGIIESIANQTANGTETTAQSIENLAQLVQELHESVAEFKLPD